MSWSSAAASALEIVRRLAAKLLPTVEEEAQSDRAKAEKGFLAWLKKAKTYSNQQETKNSDDSLK